MKVKEKQEEFVGRLIEWGRGHLREYPWRSTRDALKILIAEVFLQRTPADRVAERFDDLVSAFGDDIAELDEAVLMDRFRDLGLSKRISWLIRTRRQMDRLYRGETPRDRDDLLKLLGIGLYTANAILCLAFDERLPLVDGNVIRVLTRVFGFESDGALKPTSKVQILATLLLPKENARLYNLSLLDFGALVCRKRPLCDRCPLPSVCAFFSEMKTFTVTETTNIAP